MSHPEAVFMKKSGKYKHRGRMIFSANTKQIKSKWSERVVIMSNPVDINHFLPITNSYYNDLMTLYPDAPTTLKPNGTRVAGFTSYQYNYFFQVVNGEVTEQLWNDLASAWNTDLSNRYIVAGRDKAGEQFFDSDIEPISGLRNALGKDERGDVDLIDTWVWGTGDKKIAFITSIDGWVESDYNITDWVKSKNDPTKYVRPPRKFIDYDSVPNSILKNTDKNDLKNNKKQWKPNRIKKIPKSNIFEAEDI